MATDKRVLPEVTAKDLIVWDDHRSQCAGYLNKKASKTSAFSKGKWQKRWFLIDIDIDEKSNYALSYYHNPDDKLPRQTFPLAKASIKIAGSNSFTFSSNDQSVLTLSADSNELMKMWVETLENVISVANKRARVLRDMEDFGDANIKSDDKSTRRYSLFRSELGITPPKLKNARKVLDKSPTKLGVPAVRLDIDSESIPPTSKARHQFMELFIEDLSKALDILPDMIEVLQIKPAPGMDWLTLVEFDINPAILLQQTRHDRDSFEAERQDIRRRLLWTLHSMVADTSSALYNGFVTSKLDPSFSANMIEREMDEDEIIPYSTDPDILKIMEQYKDIHVPADAVDGTHFSIELYFEERMAVVKVPNPQVLRKRCCALWPYEVKQALGFMGNMQELWIEPIALVPKDMPKMLSQPIPFKPSVRCGGQLLINATHLKADMAYDVTCEDKRDEALNSLTPDEMDQIKATFSEYDLNGDGGISKEEMSELVRRRTTERKAIIEEKYESFLAEPGLSADEIANAESNRAMLLQSVHEAQNKLLKMFDAADINGDGVISFTEFIMAEAWWLRCTINPERAHLF